MDGSGVGAGLASAALAAGGAWVFFTIIPDTWRAARIPVTIVAAILGLMNGCSHSTDDSTPSVAQIERQLVEAHDFGALAHAFRARDPEGFAAYVQEIHDASAAGTPLPQALMSAAGGLQMRAEARFPFLLHSDFVAYYEIKRDEMLWLREQDPSLCRVYFHGSPENVAPIALDPAIAERRLALYTRAFSSNQPTMHQPLSPAEWEERRTDLHQRTYDVVGDDIALIAVDSDAQGREARQCEVIAEFYNQFALSPEPGRIFVTLRGSPA